jgi:predicted house-cleaning noncanonical NTP pyrophosphatase (MazG superfamily)
MKTDIIQDIIQNIIWNAGSIENLLTLKQDDETRREYRERLYEEAHELFMDSVEELELDSLNDDIRDEAIQDIVDMLSGKKS